MDILLCQQDSYLRECESTVLACHKVEGKDDEYTLVLDDTCLYPEGGGQPFDLGTVSGVEVLRVDTCSGGTKVLTKKEFQVGERVHCQVDWERRYVFMQQHTCQHLLSAVVSILFGYDTVKWELGSKNVAVDFELSRAFTSEEIRLVEEKVNEHARAALPVTYSIVGKDDLDAVTNLRGRPKGKALELEQLRLVTIGDLDSNPCGGTHLASTSEIMMFKVVGAEIDRGSSRLLFLCGNRVLENLSDCLAREARLCATLGVGPSDLSQSVEILYKERRDASKQIKSLTEELASLYGASLAKNWKAASIQALVDGVLQPPYIVCNRPNSTLAFLQEAADTIMTLNDSMGLGLQAVYLSGGVIDASGANVGKPGKKGKGKKPADPMVTTPVDPNIPLSGAFVVYGSSAAVLEPIKERLYSVVDGKGGGRPGRLQGQAVALQNMLAVEELFFQSFVTAI